jgi:hypothetical protein
MKRIIPVFLFVIFGLRSVIAAQQPTRHPPLFFREAWKQTGPEHGVDAGAVTNQNLELKLYDPGAKNIATYAQNPPTGSRPSDWGGPSCIQSAGFNQNRHRLKFRRAARPIRPTCGPASA